MFPDSKKYLWIRLKDSQNGHPRKDEEQNLEIHIFDYCQPFLFGRLEASSQV
jgi:hypothetical protein